MNLTSINAFAKSVGVDESLVRRWVRENRFTDAAIHIDDRGRKKLISDIALSEWTAGAGGSEKGSRLQPKKGNAGTTSPRPDDSGDPGASMAGGSVFGDGIDNPNISKAKAEHYKALTLEVEYKKLIGDLVPKDKVYRQLFNAGAELRAGLFTIPDQAIDDILAARDRTTAHRILYAAIEKVLDKYTDPAALDKQEDEGEE